MKKILLLTILIFTVNLIFSQTFVYNESDNMVVKIQYGEGGANNNAIVKKMAEGNNQNYNTYKIKVKFTADKKINKTANVNTLQLNIKDLEIKGDYFYKTFNMKKYLLPAQISLDLNYFVNDAATKTFDIPTKNFKTGKITEQSVVIPIETPENAAFKFDLINVILIYDSKNKSDFDKRIATIEAYYASSKQLQKEIDAYENIVIDETVLSSLDDLQQIFDYKQIAVKSEEFVNSTKRQNFYSELPLNNNDPENLKPNLETLRDKSARLKTICNNIIQKLDIIYYDRGMLMLAKNDIRMAQFYFNKSIEQNKNFAPAHYQIAKINFDNQNLEQSLNILLDIYKMNPDVETINKSNSLANLIFFEYIEVGNNFNAQNKFNDAIVWLDKANYVCQNISAVVCSEELHRGYETAVIGNFNNQLAIVDKNINENKLQEAEKQLNGAMQYRADNIGYLPDNQTIISRHNQIYTEYVLNGNSFLKTKKFQAALTEYSNAKRICNKYTYVECTQELENGVFDAHTGVYTQKVDAAQAQLNSGNLDQAEQYVMEANNYQISYNLNKDSRIDSIFIKIKQTRYDNNIAEGAKQVKYQNYEQALIHYNKAKTIENEYNIKKNRNLTSYINSTAKSLILQTVEKGEKKVNVNDLSSARVFLQSAVDLKNQYNIRTDNEVNTAIENLNGKIFKQQCLNYRAEYDSNYQKAVSFIFEKNYIKADEFLTEAINVANTHSECMIDASNADYKKQEIANAVNYQKQMQEITLNYGRGQYQKVIDDYLKTTEYFNTKRLGQNYSLEHVDLYEYIKGRSNAFINYSVNYYIGQDELEKSLSLLKILEQRGYKNKYAKNNQKLLGTKLARRDQPMNPEIKSKDKVLDYTAGSKWFKHLAKAYKKQWKKM